MYNLDRNKAAYLGKISMVLIMLAYFAFFIRYFIPTFPFLYSINDILWEISFIFILKIIFMNYPKLFYFTSFSFLILMLIEENSQKYFLNEGLFTTTYSHEDVIAYIVGYIIAIISIKILLSKYEKNKEKENVFFSEA